MITNNFSTLEQELNYINSLSESQAQEEYNVDYKSEAIEAVKDHWSFFSSNDEEFEDGYYLDFCYKNWN